MGDQYSLIASYAAKVERAILDARRHNCGLPSATNVQWEAYNAPAARKKREDAYSRRQAAQSEGVRCPLCGGEIDEEEK